MRRSGEIVMVFLGAALQGALAAVSLTHLGTVYLPTRYNPGPVFQFNTAAAEQSAFSPTQKYVYTVGNNILHVIDASDPRNMQILYYDINALGDATDVEVCGQFVVTAIDNKDRHLEGKVFIYRLYNPTTGTLERVNEITVGAVPDMVKLTKDCRKIIVAIEGEVRTFAGQTVDPEGGVGIIEFDSADLAGSFQFRVADFTSFNARADEYIARGVRWVWRGENSGITNTFSQDLEPEYITLNKDETKAYVSLQENNAIAVVDIATASVDELYGLGYKDWQNSGLDASDRDHQVNIRPWRVRGLYQPDSITYLSIHGQNYILTANEGDYKKYEGPNFNFEWDESLRGKKFGPAGLIDDSVPSDLQYQLAADEELGRLKFTTVDGKTASGTYDSFYTFGGRGISLFRSSDLTLAWDSANRLERDVSISLSDVFNSNGKDAALRPSESKDTRSDNMGPETESIAYGDINGKLYVFTGVERPGIVITYSVPSSGPIDLVFEGIHYAGGFGSSYEELWQSRVGRDLDPEDLRFISAAESPTGKPLLLISGSVSGTMSLYEIVPSVQKTPSVQANRNASAVPPAQYALHGNGITPIHSVNGISIAAICLAAVAILVSGFILVLKLKKGSTSGSVKYDVTESNMNLPDAEAKVS